MSALAGRSASKLAAGEAGQRVWQRGGKLGLEVAASGRRVAIAVPQLACPRALPSKSRARAKYHSGQLVSARRAAHWFANHLTAAAAFPAAQRGFQHGLPPERNSPEPAANGGRGNCTGKRRHNEQARHYGRRQRLAS